MKNVMIKNISKISFLNSKIETINSLIKNRNYKEAYKATAALVELVNVVLLEKVYNEKVESSNIINLIKILEKKENDIANILTEINGEYNLINYERVEKRDVEFLVGYLDDIVGIIIEKYGNIY